MAVNFLAGHSGLWVQPDGANSVPQYLGCHKVGDIADPKGTSTLLWCPDPNSVGKFVVKGKFKGEPAVITTNIETDLRKTADYLEDLAETGCAFPIYVNKIFAGRRDVFTNFDRSFILLDAEITSANLSNLSARSPSDEGETLQTFELSVSQVLRIFNLEAARYTLTETEGVNGIDFAGESRCETLDDTVERPEDYVVASTDALLGSASNTADVLISQNGGAFAATAADPFAGGEDITGIIAFQISRTENRIMVARGTTDGANPAEIAYSDDDGATWSTVDVGSTNGEYVANAQALTILDRYHIWLGTDGGQIYFSADAGETWTVQDAAVISATDVMAIQFISEEVGFAVYTGGEVAKCADGLNWTQVTDSGSTDVKDLNVLSANRAWVAGSDGLFFTHDAGVTWASRLSGDIAAVDFLNPLFGIVVGGSGTNDTIQMTINGGYDWSALTSITNSGYTDVKCVSTKLAFVAGNINGSTGMIAKLTPVD